MGSQTTAFERITAEKPLAAAVQARWVPLQAELLRAGAYWEESLAVLREMVAHERTFPSAADALAWYRQTYHPSP